MEATEISIYFKELTIPSSSFQDMLALIDKICKIRRQLSKRGTNPMALYETADLLSTRTAFDNLALDEEYETLSALKPDKSHSLPYSTSQVNKEELVLDDSQVIVTELQFLAQCSLVLV